MGFKTVFKRLEYKYLITKEQKENILSTMGSYMFLDCYGRTTIRNLYFDTESYLLIRRSIESPIYKEKLRIRSYQTANENSTVFVELKKKYDKVVYKRRLSLTEKEAMEWTCGRRHLNKTTQISREIDYFLDYYGDLFPRVFLCYDREAYFSPDDAELRITFDENILCRRNDLSLCCDAYGDRLIDDGYTLMEIKCSGGMPLWLVHILSEEKIYKGSFSKYGTAYKTMIYPEAYNKERV
ncbi:MAG: polyphosphate polymerase domain-containing protein [Ruminococcaceae bacterium]|nr:polyphosphate polymerase domain-containing protein [Oscillospiraceae bacterium]